MGSEGRCDLQHSIEQWLPQAIRLLAEERPDVPRIPDDPRAQWDLFRALVNVRPPAPAPDGFLEVQDALLQDIHAYRGVTRLGDIDLVPGRTGVRIWRGDITTLATDAIVNAANSQMLGCFVPGHHCIDNAIHTFAGVQLRLECARLMEQQGAPEPTGMAKATSAFNLPSKHVIHAVGPIAQGAVSQADCALLANCYTSCLDVAADLGCRSIAFCCISTGVFGFPQRQAAEVAVRAVEGWLAAHDGTAIDVVFNVFTDADEQLYRSLL